MYLREKLGSKCCGCFCDYRRAVIWANSSFIGYATFLLLSRDSVVQLAYDNFDDDAFSDEVSGIVDDYYRKRSIPLGICLATSLLSQIGAVLFRQSLVALHALALTADFIAFCFLALQLYQDMQVAMAQINQVPAPPVMSFLLNGVLTLLFLYPQIGFLLECRLGIMTAATYPREDYCCCGRRKPQFPPTAAIPEQYPAPSDAALSPTLSQLSQQPSETYELSGARPSGTTSPATSSSSNRLPYPV